MLNGVDTASVAGRSGLPMLLFKARDNNGTWTFGQKKTIVEDGSRWAVNPGTFQRGYICLGDGNKKLGERCLPVSQPMLNVTELPDKGFEWQEQWAVNMRCLNGADAGTEVVFKTSTVGGIQAIAGLIAAVRDRLNSGQHDGKVVADRAARKVLLPARAVREDLDPHADDRRLDVAGRSGDGAYRRRRRRRRRHVGCRAAAPPPRRMTRMRT